MLAFITSLLEVSLGCSIAIAGLLLLSPIIKKRYGAKWKYWIWLLLAIRLLLPFDIHLSQEYEIVLPEVNMLHGSQSQGNNAHITTDKSRIGEPLTFADSQIETTTTNHQTLYKKSAEPMSAKEILVYLWVGGMLLFMLYHLLAYHYMRHQVLRWSRPIRNVYMIQEIDRMAARMHINRHMRCYVCEKIWSPMMIGLVKPILLFPKECYSQTELHFIIKHEYMHYKRRDIWYKLLLLIVNGMHWFNPLVYVMRQKASKDIELCCDEDVVKYYSFEQRKQYGRTILASISYQHKHPAALCTYFNQGKKTVKDRLGGIVNMHKKRNGIMLFGVFAASTLIVSGLLTFNSVTAKQKDTINVTEETQKSAVVNNKKTVDSGSEAYMKAMDRLTDAVLSNDISYVKDVIREGNIDLNTQDSKGEYPLEVTLIMTNCEMAQLLLDEGADPYLTTAEGETIYDKAMASDSKYYMEIFKSYQAYAQSETAQDNSAGQYYFTTTTKEAVEFYIKALIESNYNAIHAISYGSDYQTDGQEIFDTIKIESIKLLHGESETRGNKAYYALELNIADGGNSAFEAGIFPRWLYLKKGEQGWYAEGLMTDGAPDEDWWNSEE